MNTKYGLNSEVVKYCDTIIDLEHDEETDVRTLTMMNPKIDQDINVLAKRLNQVFTKKKKVIWRDNNKHAWLVRFKAFAEIDGVAIQAHLKCEKCNWQMSDNDCTDIQFNTIDFDEIYGNLYENKGLAVDLMKAIYNQQNDPGLTTKCQKRTK